MNRMEQLGNLNGTSFGVTWCNLIPLECDFRIYFWNAWTNLVKRVQPSKTIGFTRWYATFHRKNAVLLGSLGPDNYPNWIWRTSAVITTYWRHRSKNWTVSTLNNPMTPMYMERALLMVVESPRLFRVTTISMVDSFIQVFKFYQLSFSLLSLKFVLQTRLFLVCLNVELECELFWATTSRVL